MTSTTTTQGLGTGLGTGPGERVERIGRHMSGVLVGAFSLSVVHTVYAGVEGVEDPTFTVDTPLAWGFYLVAFAMAGLARRSEQWAQLVVLAYLVVVLGIALFYYPTVFGPEQQTVFGWFENGVYVGLLFVATYLGVVRLRRVALLPA